jgi:hypothetical protein
VMKSGRVDRTGLATSHAIERPPATPSVENHVS